MLSIEKVIISLLEAILFLSGVNAIEDLQQSDLDRLNELSENKICINSASRSELLESGLFSPYQVASLLNYIQNTGDILSVDELAVVDGFNTQYASALSYFVDFQSDSKLGLNSSLRTRLKNCSKISSIAGNKNLGIKYDFSLENKFDVKLGLSGLKKMNSMTLASSFSAKKFKFFIGDYNAKFGQGLALWNTLSMDSYYSSSSMIKRPTGFNLSSSFTASSCLTGLGANYSFSKHSFSLGFAMPGFKENLLRAINKEKIKNVIQYQGIFNYSYWGDRISLSTTANIQKNPSFSTDVRTFLFSTDFASEIAVCKSAKTGQWEAKAVFASSTTLGEYSRLSNNILYTPQVQSLSSCYDFLSRKSYTSLSSHSATAAINLLYKPSTDALSVKSFLKYKYTWNENHFYLQTKLNYKAKEKYRAKIDLLGHYTQAYYLFQTSFRLNYAYSKASSLLSYIEQAYLNESISLSIFYRLGVFFVDNWEDRLYVYERDIQYYFNVPAMYGRGYWTSFYLNWKFMRKSKFSLRISYTDYPFMPIDKKKDARFELRTFILFTF